jgi:hypothetical protein
MFPVMLVTISSLPLKKGGAQPMGFIRRTSPKWHLMGVIARNVLFDPKPQSPRYVAV